MITEVVSRLMMNGRMVEVYSKVHNTDDVFDESSDSYEWKESIRGFVKTPEEIRNITEVGTRLSHSDLVLATRSKITKGEMIKIDNVKYDIMKQIKYGGLNVYGLKERIDD